MTVPSTFLDATARATRTTEVDTADWNTGMNWGNCNPGIGISGDGQKLLSGEPNGWTLLDQAEAARTPQDGQSIGGVGLNGGVTTASDQPFLVATPGDGDGEATATGSASLVTLDAGWVAV